MEHVYQKLIPQQWVESLTAIFVLYTVSHPLAKAVVALLESRQVPQHTSEEPERVSMARLSEKKGAFEFLPSPSQFRWRWRRVVKN